MAARKRNIPVNSQLREQHGPRPIDLQLFAGGSNLHCQTCSYYRDGLCALHQKQINRKSQACSHYQAKQ